MKIVSKNDKLFYFQKRNIYTNLLTNNNKNIFHNFGF